MPTDIGRDEVRRLVGQGAQLVEVLSKQAYDSEHLADAINIPLETLGRQSTARLDHVRPVITYCHDTQ